MYFESQLTVEYAETGVDARLKPGIILNYLQDAATDHCVRMGISGIDLLPRNLAWVVYRYHLQIHRYPVWKDELIIKTWRYPQNNLYELRCFDVKDACGRLLIAAKSVWVLTRLDTHRPVRLKPHLPEAIMAGEQIPIENDFTELPESTEMNEPRSFWVRMHDLDFNRHVNNTIYAIWAMESVPGRIAETCLPKEIAIQYQGEAVFGDKVTAFAQRLKEEPDFTYVHTLYNEGKKNGPITRLLTRWQPIENFPGA